jgi:hypothetical protein
MKSFTITLTEEEMNIIEESLRIAMTERNRTPLPKMSDEEATAQFKSMSLWKRLKSEINK